MVYVVNKFDEGTIYKDDYNNVYSMKSVKKNND